MSDQESAATARQAEAATDQERPSLSPKTLRAAARAIFDQWEDLEDSDRRNLFARLILHAKEDLISFPSAKTLGEITGLHPTTIKRSNARLRRRGLLREVPRPGRASRGVKGDRADQIAIGASIDAPIAMGARMDAPIADSMGASDRRNGRIHRRAPNEGTKKTPPTPPEGGGGGGFAQGERKQAEAALRDAGVRAFTQAAKAAGSLEAVKTAIRLGGGAPGVIFEKCLDPGLRAEESMTREDRERNEELRRQEAERQAQATEEHFASKAESQAEISAAEETFAEVGEERLKAAVEAVIEREAPWNRDRLRARMKSDPVGYVALSASIRAKVIEELQGAKA
ncbi:MAG: hypothetical protein ACF8R7_07270 [Phycisphaerales bacterium JB039]